MLVLEVQTGDKEEFSLFDGLIREVTVLDGATSTIYHWVNSDYLDRFGLETNLLTEEETETLTLSSLNHQRELTLDGEPYTEIWTRDTLAGMTDRLGDLIDRDGDYQRLVSTYGLDLGIFLANIEVPFLEDGVLPLNSNFMLALSNPLDFTTLAEILKLDIGFLYTDDISIQARLIGIHKILQTLDI